MTSVMHARAKPHRRAKKRLPVSAARACSFHPRNINAPLLPSEARPPQLTQIKLYTIAKGQVTQPLA